MRILVLLYRGQIFANTLALRAKPQVAIQRKAVRAVAPGSVDFIYNVEQRSAKGEPRSVSVPRKVGSPKMVKAVW